MNNLNTPAQIDAYSDMKAEDPNFDYMEVIENETYTDAEINAMTKEIKRTPRSIPEVQTELFPISLTEEEAAQATQFANIVMALSRREPSEPRYDVIAEICKTIDRKAARKTADNARLMWKLV